MVTTFQPGDIVRTKPGFIKASEKEVYLVDANEGVLFFTGDDSMYMLDAYELVFRPATRDETEKLRNIAKAASEWKECERSEEGEAWRLRHPEQMKAWRDADSNLRTAVYKWEAILLASVATVQGQEGKR